MTTTHRIVNHPIATGAVAAVLALTFASRDPDGLAREADAFVSRVVPLV